MSSASTDRVATPSPAELTSYVGRRDEGADVRRLLGKARLVTLSGPGGVGKTRLAWRVVRDVARAFPDGVVFVELAEVRDGALAANLVADRLGLHDRSGLAPMRQVLDHLRNRALLLVLDNCEHLIVACAEFVAARWERVGLAPEFAASLPHAKHTAAARAAIGDTRFDRAYDAGRAMPADEAVNYALGEPARKPDGVTEKKLTTRETEIAKLVAKGLTNRDIAARLVISQRTVDSHVEHILAKLGFGNRTQIAAWVAGHGR
ncbi:LuxR C-terminal-related transcriptional regulator [Amycolatopsis japonica]|uniref:response regulator transcription factor n=1 Tax=Amycolatopsis japonica TaxID=208439 RepID=UPI00332FC54A